MTYYEFIKKTYLYLNSVRVLKNYISFDMVFPKTWVMVKKLPDGLELITNQDANGTTINSFVCENDENKINGLEKIIDTIIKTNLDREEKESLFKSKVQELKSIFEKENLESLKGLKFDMEELTKLMQNEPEGIELGDKEGN